ncbi:fructose-bisphosphatase class III, partial [Butyricicoccus sp. 1XD8-22]
MATYVCSDIHGEFHTWLLALENCDISLENGDNLVILGDLIDRG